MAFLTTEELAAGVDEVRGSPADGGTLELIVRRPDVEVREVVDVGELRLAEGLLGDNWRTRGSSSTDDGSAHPEKQLNIINARAIALISPDAARRPLAGDQLHLDLDLSPANLPTGTRLAIGTAVIEVTEPPHLGCKKFSERFGIAAVRFVNSPVGKELRLRGINARVVQEGTITTGDTVHKV